MQSEEDRPDSSSPGSGDSPSPDMFAPGSGALLTRMPEWFRRKRPGEPVTPAEEDKLREWFRPIAEQGMKMYAQRFDRQAVLELLPDWMYDKLPTNEPITEADQVGLRAHFALYHPNLAERIDPVAVVVGWRYGVWYMRNHGHPAPTLLPRRDGARNAPSGS